MKKQSNSALHGKTARILVHTVQKNLPVPNFIRVENYD